MRMTEDTTLLKRKQGIDAERKAAAIARRRQAMLAATTPGVATPASIMRFMTDRRFAKHGA